ncbi:MAG: bifunctional metallophosphatase/5'-nucleotidase, partial [Betaproteobacteria bacterium]|nr:bifunctional metallophosphatase/5'-nucleotidase [Betaproteobacteria bacterium]
MLLVGTILLPRASFADDVSRRKSVSVKIIAINDFHGNLKPPFGGIRIRNPLDLVNRVQIGAGGAEHLATAVARLRARNPNSVFVGAGDLVGATPLLSALFNDEPSIESLNLMGLSISAVGNHEFDRGRGELLRLQGGGCHPIKGCQGPKPFEGARFQYLAASTVEEDTGRTILPSYAIRSFEGIPVAFIGLTLAATPSMVTPSSVQGLRFLDEASTVNNLLPSLREQGIFAYVVLIHEGGIPIGDYNECQGISGPIVDIVNRIDSNVKLVISGHTHRAYNCLIGGKRVTSADKYGTMLTDIDIEIDRVTKKIVTVSANNIIVMPEVFEKDAGQSELIRAYEQLAEPLAKRVVARLNGAVLADVDAKGESALGRLIADAQLAATQNIDQGGAQIAFMNLGGVRAPLIPQANGDVRYEDLFAAQPFYNHLVTMTLTGEQIIELLEHQWQDDRPVRLLIPSKGFAYRWDQTQRAGKRIVSASVSLNKKPIESSSTYRVTVNS